MPDKLVVTITLEIDREDRSFRWISNELPAEDAALVYESLNKILELSRANTVGGQSKMVH